MSDLSQLATYLASQGEGSVGTTIRIGLMPNDQDNGISLIASGDLRSAAKVNTGSVAGEFPRIQIFVRNVDGQAAIEQAESIVKKLNAVMEQDMSGVRWHGCAAHKPLFLGVDELDRAQYSVNVDVLKQPNP